MKGRMMRFLIGIGAGYLLLLFILLLSERTDPASGIRTLWDALWYSLVTLTTVGYGDLYPVTAAGRVVGLIFLVGSLGLLGTAAATVFSLLREKLGSRLRLSRLRGKTVYLFSEENPSSAALAAALSREEEEAAVVFCGSDRPGEKAGKGNIHRWAAELPELLQQYGDSLQIGGIFLMSGEPEKNREAAGDIGRRDCGVYAMLPEAEAPAGVRPFDAPLCAARMYWRKYPLAKNEGTVLMIGDGPLARHLLEKAIQVNCRIPFAKSEYHLFGDWEEYRLLHPAFTGQLFASEDPEQDRFIFHEEPWMADPALLLAADRILFCADDPAENLRAAGSLKRLFPHRGQVDAWGGRMPEGIRSFGAPEEILTPETVIRQAQDRAARRLHEEYCRKAGQENPWESLTEFQRDSNRGAADHLGTKLALLTPGEDDLPARERIEKALGRLSDPGIREKARKCEHERWMRFHWERNWQYGEEKDRVLRTHPCLIPYEALSPEEQAKDDTAWENLRMLEQEEVRA